LLHEIDLKPHNISNFFRVPRDGNHGEKIHERLATFAIIDEADLRLFPVKDLIL
jgi:hypothetical protein